MKILKYFGTKTDQIEWIGENCKHGADLIMFHEPSQTVLGRFDLKLPFDAALVASWAEDLSHDVLVSPIGDYWMGAEFEDDDEAMVFKLTFGGAQNDICRTCR